MKKSRRIFSLLVTMFVILNVVSSFGAIDIGETQLMKGTTTFAATVESIRGGNGVDSIQALSLDYTPISDARSTTEAALTFDNTHSDEDFYSLGFGDEESGWIIVEFDEIIVNGPGNDIRVIEDTWNTWYPEESADIFVSANGIDWEYIGEAKNDYHDDKDHTVSEFDLDDVTVINVRFVKVQDTSSRSNFKEVLGNLPDGFDLNVVLAIYTELEDEYDVYFDTYNTGGSVSKTIDTYALGDNTDVVVTPNSGYEFVQWWGEFMLPIEVDDSEEESVPTLPNPEYYEMVYLPISLGDLDGNQLKVDGLMVSADGVATHTMMPVGATGFITKILAEFKEIPAEPITITIAVGGNPGTSSATSNSNTATLNSSVSFDILPGAPINFSVSTAGNRDFDGWDKSLPEVAPNEDTTYTAIFSTEPNTSDYDLVVTQDGQGTVNTGDFNNLTGTFVIGPVEAAQGWEFTGFFGDDGEDVNGPNANGDYTINMNADKSIEAVFEPTDPPQALPISLTVNVVGQGNIESYELLGEFGEVTEGDVITFGPLQGVNGYKFTEIGGVNGDDLIIVNDTTFNLVMDGSKVIDILFELEEEFLDEEVPKDSPLPQTGGLPISLLTVFGGLLTSIGIKFKTKK